MIDHETRTAIFKLHEKGHSYRAIQRSLGISRHTIRKIIENGETEVPKITRKMSLDPHRDQIIDLYRDCRGNLIRVNEELETLGIEVPYSTLCYFCRQNGIGVKPIKVQGSYEFEPASEMQFDTSPHTVEIDGKARKIQCASLVLAHSRMIFAQAYPSFDRFYCKVFLTEGIKYFQGAAKLCVIDNTNVVIAHGTGANAKPAPEMEAFANRFGFEFLAHEIGDSNRKARVEGPFYHIERNFYAGRTFKDLKDLNEQFILWCDKESRRFRRSFQSMPIDLYQTEKLKLSPLPLYIPNVYQLVKRTVTAESLVILDTNKYSVKPEYIGKQVDVHAGLEELSIFHKHDLIAKHKRQQKGKWKKTILPEHKKAVIENQSYKKKKTKSEILLCSVSKEFEQLISILKTKHRGQAGWQVRHLYRMYLDYPTEILQGCIARALEYKLSDLNRIETMVLKDIRGEYFLIN